MGACIITEMDITSTKIFEEEGFNRGDTVLLTDDGFVILGYSHIGNREELWLLKITKDKKEIWRKKYKFKEEYVLPYDLVKAEDGYLIFGQIENPKEKTSEMVLLKTDETGNEQWQRYYEEGYLTMARSILSVEDGFILVGTTAIEKSGGKSLLYPLTVKTDKEGIKQWQKVYGEGVGHVICKTTDGYFMVGEDGEDLQFMQIDKEGDEIWSKTHERVGVEWPVSVFSLSDGFVIAGYTSQHGGDFLLMKVDTEGNEEWLKRYDNEGEFPHYALETEEEFIIVGATFSDMEAEKDVFIIKTDREGNEQWRKIYGDEKDQIAYSLSKDNGGFLIVGLTTTNDEGDLVVIEIE
jgi:hypothetical protein